MTGRNLGLFFVWIIFTGLLPVAVKADSYGTGFFITSDGYLVTNHHVIDGQTKLSVLQGKKWIEVALVMADPTNDLAILKAPGSNFSALSLDFSADVRPGDSAFTIGFPDPNVLGFSPKTTKGEISALTGIKDDPRFYQTTVAIQPGNSGGALCDMSGNVVGVTTSTLNTLRAKYIPQNVNYALKSSYVRPLVQSIPGVLSKLNKPLNLGSFRDVQSRVEQSVVSIKAERAITQSPPPEVTGPVVVPVPPRPSDTYLIVSYNGKEGINIRDSRNTGTKGNLHGALFQQTEMPLVQIGDLITENSTQWVQLKVVGWVAVENSKRSLLDDEGDGTWKVRKMSDGFVAMRTGPATKYPMVCKLAFATVVKELERDFSDADYKLILAEFSGWVVKKSDQKEYVRRFFP